MPARQWFISSIGGVHENSFQRQYGANKTHYTPYPMGLVIMWVVMVSVEDDTMQSYRDKIDSCADWHELQSVLDELTAELIRRLPRLTWKKMITASR
jgi:hypothetical protein